MTSEKSKSYTSAAAIVVAVTVAAAVADAAVAEPAANAIWRSTDVQTSQRWLILVPRCVADGERRLAFPMIGMQSARTSLPCHENRSFVAGAPTCVARLSKTLKKNYHHRFRVTD
jgi:hypothetical protein